MTAKQPLELAYVKDVDWTLRNPCGDCPFLKTSPYHEGVAGNLPTYADSIMQQQFAHTCHKTDNRPECDGPRNFKGDRPQHCVGALLMLLKTGRTLDLQLPLLQAAEEGKLDLKELTERAKQAANVFTWGEMLTFYEAKMRGQLRSPAMRAEARKQRRRKERSR